MDDKKNEFEIFENGYVKNDEIEKIEIDEEILEETVNVDEEMVEQTIDDNSNENYANNQEFIRNSTSNEEKIRAQVDELLEDFDKRAIKKEKRKNKKNLFLLFGILIELVIIFFIVKGTIFKEKYYNMISCTNETNQNGLNYDITMKNIYYFDKKDNLAKQEINVVYIFDKEKDYQDFKNNYQDSNIKNYDGIIQSDLFDDINYVYQNKTIYIVSKLKKNKKTVLNDNLITMNIENRDALTLYIDNYDNIMDSNNKAGFTCE